MLQLIIELFLIFFIFFSKLEKELDNVDTNESSSLDAFNSVILICSVFDGFDKELPLYYSYTFNQSNCGPFRFFSTTTTTIIIIIVIIKRIKYIVRIDYSPNSIKHVL